MFDGSSYIETGSSINGTDRGLNILQQQIKQLSGSDDNGNALAYDVGGGLVFADIYLNGVKLVAGTDFTATNGTSIVLASGAAASDILEVTALELST